MEKLWSCIDAWLEWRVGKIVTSGQKHLTQQCRLTVAPCLPLPLIAHVHYRIGLWQLALVCSLFSALIYSLSHIPAPGDAWVPPVLFTGPPLLEVPRPVLSWQATSLVTSPSSRISSSFISSPFTSPSSITVRPSPVPRCDLFLVTSKFKALTHFRTAWAEGLARPL